MIDQVDLEDRFWSKVSIPENIITGCWVWDAGKFRSGYGGFSVGDRTHRAHRIAFELVNGLLGDDEILMHSCDHPYCVNPNHLSKGTHQDNMRDKAQKGRATKKMTVPEVLEIRHLSSYLTQDHLAYLFDVTQSMISLIVRRKLWQHV